ncbi:MAG: SusC/RagA family TonB-linked outer membrane protein [Bacteroidota bacterium]
MKVKFTKYLRQLLVLITIVALNSAYAVSTGQPGLEDTKLSLSVREGKVIQLMNEISEKTAYNFIYEDEIKTELEKKVQVQQGANLQEILKEISRNSNLEFRAVNNNIVVRKRTAVETQIAPNSVLQGAKITGKITSADDDSGLPGVNIVEKGTTNGTVTDIEGNYSLNLNGSAPILVISSVGFETQEITVGGQSVIDVVLSSDVTALGEVVVTALGLKRAEASLGYSVGKLDGDELTDVVQENVLNSLAGRVTGVTINSTGGPGSSVSMVIRGASSLTSDNQPLFVIDGIPMNSTLNNVTEMARDTKVDYGNAITDINPEDIESMTVLKGPSAAALYGSRAGNGVVLITTKSGKKSKGVGVSFSTNTVLEMPYKYLETHNLFANGQRPYTQNNRPNNGLDYYSVPAADTYWVGPELDKGMMAYQWPYFNANGDLEARPLVSHPDNAKEFFNDGFTTTNNVAITNQTDKLNYRLSYSNMQNKGVVPNSDLHRNTLGLSSTYNVTSKVSVTTNINFTTTGANNRPAGNRGANPIQYLYDLNSFIDINDVKNYWMEGKEGIQQNGPYNLAVNGDGTYGVGDMMDNPYFIANEINNPFKRDRLYGNAQLDYKITDDLLFTVKYNHDQFQETRETKIAQSYSNEPNGFYGVLDMYRREQNSNFLLTYTKNVSDFSISASAGGNLMHQYGTNHQTQSKNRGTGLIIPNVFTVGNVAPDNITYSSNYYQKSIYSIYGLASLGFKDAIYLDLTARNDWSSTLPAANRSYFYPSASLSIILNEMVDMGSIVSLAKLRGGWAQVGNDTDPYRLISSMSNSGNWGNITRLSTSGTILLPDLKPEIQTSIEFGADLALFNNRLRFEGTVYKSENENQILSIGLPPSSGWSSKQINAGLISSKGVEIGLGGTPVSSKDWRWDINFNFTRNRVKIEELAEGFDYIRLWSDAKGGAYTWVGENIGQIIDRALVRVEDPNSPYYGWPIIDDEGWESSNSQLADADGNRVAPVIGNFNPDFMLGMQTSINYKRFTLSASFDWRKGGQFVSQTLRYGESDLHTKRWLDKVHDLSGVENIPQYLKDHADQFLSPDGEFFVLVGGPSAEYGGLEFTEDGITLNDGVFMPGVQGYYDGDGNFIMERENLGDANTPLIRYQDYYGWSYTRNATFDADFVKLRELSLSYRLPSIQGIQNASVSLYTRNVILWTKAGINIDPEKAFQPEASSQGSGIQFKQGIERYNVMPWTFPIGVKLNITL